MATTVIDVNEILKRSWDISQIVTTYPPIEGQKVASVNDFVWDWDSGIYRVSAIDSITKVATLEPRLRFTDSTLLDPSNGSLISSLSMYQPNSATYAMVDKDVYPYTITTDPRYVTRGVEATQMRAFLGTDVSDTGTVISGNYNGSGDLVSDIITLVDADGGTPTPKRPPVFATKAELTSEMIITYVFYDATGRKVGTQPFLVAESAGIFDYATGSDYITGIELRGDLIDDTDATVINNPLGTPFQTALLEAWLTYYSGNEVKVPIDGNKCVLHGINNFNESVLGYPKSVVLSYYPDPAEPSIKVSAGPKNHVSAGYKLRNISYDTSFSLKVFTVPVWNAGTLQYDYSYYLTNLAGDVGADVTSEINAKITGNLEVPGTDHGNQHNVTVGLDLDVVMPGAYPGHYHTQAYKLTTEIPGSVGDPWSIDYVGDGTLVYGSGAIVHGSNINNGRINIGRDFAEYVNFIGDLYTPLAALYDPETDLGPKQPTHVELTFGASTYEVDLANWKDDHDMVAGWPTMSNGDTMVAKWILRDGSNDYVLAYAPLIVVMDL